MHLEAVPVDCRGLGGECKRCCVAFGLQRHSRPYLSGTCFLDKQHTPAHLQTHTSQVKGLTEELSLPPVARQPNNEVLSLPFVTDHAEHVREEKRPGGESALHACTRMAMPPAHIGAWCIVAPRLPELVLPHCQAGSFSCACPVLRTDRSDITLNSDLMQHIVHC